MRAGFLGVILGDISRITRSFNAVLTVIQLLMVLPLVWTLYKLKINSIIPAVLVYACTFFPWSLNIMRQSLGPRFY